MKLNIGCGYRRLEGWVNIDSDPDVPADRIMSAHNLEFGDGLVQEIKALQLIEHLGFFKAKYFLSECRRVLVPGGELLIETPDPAGAFRVFLEGDEARRESALGWIYGSETKGMGHRYCFPAGLLEALLKEAGFDIAGSSGFDYQEHRPALRLKALKAGSALADLAAALRKRLLLAGVACFEDELTAAGQEAVIKALVSARSPAQALAQAVYSAEIVCQYFSLLPEGAEGAEYKICERLLAEDLQGSLMAELEKRAVKGVFSAEDYNSVLAAGAERIARGAAGGKPAALRADKKTSLFSSASAADYCLKRYLAQRGAAGAFWPGVC